MAGDTTKAARQHASDSVARIASSAATRLVRDGLPTVCSHGLGVESVALALRWCLEPETRPGPLDTITMVVAQTGLEGPDTKSLIEGVFFPFLVRNGFALRFVQVARKGPSARTDGIVVLDDTTAPRVCHIECDFFTLEDEMRSAGTIPIQSGTRKCSMHAKGDPIEVLLETHLGLAGGPFRHVFGYSVGEETRVAKSEAAIARRNHDRRRTGRAREYTHLDPWWLDRADDDAARGVGEIGDYPLLRWGWGRGEALAYIRRVLGVEWLKSACRACPFLHAATDPRVAERWRQMPSELLARDVLTELAALRLNPRMLLYKTRTLASILADAGLDDVIASADRMLSETQHAIFRVRRILPSASNVTWKRSIEAVTRGSHESMRRIYERQFLSRAIVREDHGFEYAYVYERATSFPTFEEYYTIAPAFAEDKVRSGDAFEREWRRLDPTAAPSRAVVLRELPLFAMGAD